MSKLFRAIKNKGPFKGLKIFSSKKNKIGVLPKAADPQSYPRGIYCNPEHFTPENLKVSVAPDWQSIPGHDINELSREDYEYSQDVTSYDSCFDYDPSFSCKLHRTNSIHSAWLFGSLPNIPVTPEEFDTKAKLESSREYALDLESYLSKSSHGHGDTGSVVTPRQAEDDLTQNDEPNAIGHKPWNDFAKKQLQSFEGQETPEFENVKEEIFIVQEEQASDIIYVENASCIPYEVHVQTTAIINFEENVELQDASECERAEEVVPDNSLDGNISDTAHVEDISDVVYEKYMSNLNAVDIHPETAHGIIIAETEERGHSSQNDIHYTAREEDDVSVTTEDENTVDKTKDILARIILQKAECRNTDQNANRLERMEEKNATVEDDDNLHKVKSGNAHDCNEMENIYHAGALQSENAKTDAAVMLEAETTQKVHAVYMHQGADIPDVSAEKDAYFGTSLGKEAYKLYPANGTELKLSEQELKGIYKPKEHSYQSVINTVELLDNSGHRTGIQLPILGKNSFNEKDHVSYEKRVETENNSDIQTENYKDNTGVNPLDKSLKEKTEILEITGKTMLTHYPGKIDFVEGRFEKNETEICVKIALENPQPSSNKREKCLEKFEEKHDVIESGEAKMCSKGDEKESTITKRSAIVEPKVSANCRRKSNACLVFLYMLLKPNGAEAARVHQAPVNEDRNVQGLLMAFIEIFGDHAAGITYLFALYQIARRNGRPLYNALRNFFENNIHLRARPAFPLPNAIAIQPGVRRVVARAIPPRTDHIYVLQPERRENGSVRAYNQRNPDGDTRVLRVFEPRVRRDRRVVEATEETNQGAGPSDIVPSGR